jgi:hypothetical protein
MIDHLKSTLTAAGCTLVIYENDQIANIQLDQSKPDDIIGVIIEPSTITFETTGNGVNELFPPLYVEILKQSQPEASAETNRVTLDALRVVCRGFIHSLIRSGLYKKIPNVPAVKINERKYDANVIGWQLSLTLRPIDNRVNCIDMVVINAALISTALAMASNDICAAIYDKFAV